MGHSARVLGRPWRRLVQRVLDTKGRECKLRYPGICTGVATTADHTIPWKLGGQDVMSNLEPACVPCNRHKGTSVEATDADGWSVRW